MTRWRSAARGLAGALARRVVRDNRYCIWETAGDVQRSPSIWADDEQFTIIGPDRLDAELNPRLLAFLGGDGAKGDLDGVRQGDRLLVVTIGGEYVYSGYVYFNTTAATRRQKHIYREHDESPVIGTCFSKPARIWAGPPGPIDDTTQLFRLLTELLPADADVNAAAAGFANLGSVHPYGTALTRPGDSVRAIEGARHRGKSLWSAVKEARPELDAMAEVRKVMDHASVHRRVLNDVLAYLHAMGYRRVINEVLLREHTLAESQLAMGMRVCRELHDWTLLGSVMIQRPSPADGRRGGCWRADARR